MAKGEKMKEIICVAKMFTLGGKGFKKINFCFFSLGSIS